MPPSFPLTPPSPARPYKDFLTPALHRRFTKASGLILAVCWLEAILMRPSGSSVFWSCFPLGVAGLRALMLSAPCLMVFIVRVANMHVGERTSSSPMQTLLWNITGSRLIKTLGTALWYNLSGWIFIEVFIWTRGPSAALTWVDYGRAYERTRLNENPIFLRTLHFLLASAQSILHMVRDYDRIPIDERFEQEERHASLGAEVSQIERSPTSNIPLPLQRLAAKSSRIAMRTFELTIPSMVFGLLIYFIFFRQPLWDTAFYFASCFVRDLNNPSPAPGLANLGNLAWQALTSALMVVFLWEISNAAFTIYASDPPLKKGQPLTNEIKDARGVILSKSMDPNGSLIRGLKLKNETPKSFAFWELYMICSRFPTRRKTIFTEVERPGRLKDDGTTWSQICSICVAQITSVSARIEFALESRQAQANAIEVTSAKLQPSGVLPSPAVEKLGLPKIGDQNVQDDRAILAKANSKSLGQTVGAVAKSLGQSPGATNPLDQAVQYGKGRALLYEKQAFWTSPGVIGREANQYLLHFLRSPAGLPFRQTFSRRVRGIVFGVPYSSRINAIHAAKSLARLAVASMSDDEYGQAATDIPAIVRAFTASIRAIESLVAKLEPHWSDVAFSRHTSAAREVPEVRELMVVLGRGLEEIVLAFDEYFAGLGISRTEVREAKEAIATATGRRWERDVGNLKR